MRKQVTHNDVYRAQQLRDSLKVKGSVRRGHLLSYAESFGVLINCEGGMSIDDPDLKRLRRDGLLEVERRVKESVFGSNIHVHRLVPTKLGIRRLLRGL